MTDHKDAYFFPHDANARNDPKVLMMLSVYHYEGYGWYWALLEMMREDRNHRINIEGDVAFSSLAHQLFTTPDKLRQYIKDCTEVFKDEGIGLFSKNDKALWSAAFLRRMERVRDISKKRSRAAKIGWDQRTLPGIPAEEAPEPPPAPKPKAKETWLTPYYNLWVKIMGGEPAVGQLAKALKKPHEAAGAERLVPIWEYYLKNTDARFVSPSTFAQKWGKIEEEMKGVGRHGRKHERGFDG